jgi:hypothetical protein
MIKNSNLASKICKVEISLCSNIDSISEGSSGENYRSVTLRTGCTWEEIEFTKGSATFEEPAKDTSSGITYAQALKLFFPGCDLGNVASLRQYVGKPIVVKITYTSGIIKLVGDKNNPAKLLPSYQDGDKTGTIFDIRRQSTLPALNYEE